MVRNDLPSANEYTLIGCPECEALQIVKGNPETTKCDRCRKTLQFRSLKFIYQSTEGDKVRRARALKLAERNDDRETYVELLESGALDGEIARSLSNEEFLDEMGVDVNAVASYGSTSDDDPDIPEALEIVVADVAEPTADAVVSEVVARFGYEESRVRDRLDRLRRRGDVIRRGDGTLRFV